MTQESPQKAEGARRAGVPFSEAQRAALRRLAYVHERITLTQRYNLHQFAVMMGAMHPMLSPISMAQLGYERTGLPDARIQEGAAVERVLSLAERLADLYRTAP